MPLKPRFAILVVDDDAAVRRYVGRVLRGSGYAVLEAASATEGLAALRIHPEAIDLAIVDFVMPHLSGLDLAAELHRHWPGLEVLYTSGCVDSVAMRCIMQNRPEAVLPKPFSPSALVSKVEDLLRRPSEAPGATV